MNLKEFVLNVKNKAMKKIKMSVIVASALMWGISCSSSNTDTGNTASTTETVANDAETAAATDMATGATTTQPLDTTSFPVMAASSDMFEILSSKEAQQKATNAEVKRFAEQMITDHTKSSEELKTITTRKNMLLPAAPVPMHQRMITALSTSDAKNFDRDYINAQLTAHRQAVSLFESASAMETDPKLKAFAAKHLPHLRLHLEMANQIKGKVR